MDDLLTLAMTLDRPSFIERCPHPLLLAINEPPPSLADDVNEQTQPFVMPGSAADEAPSTRPKAVYAVRKVHSLIPHAIVVGRGPTCDVVIADHQVSKAHAMFQQVGDGWELSDIGSSNGTHVNHTKAKPRGEGIPVQLGDVVSFGHRTFYFCSAADAWDRLHA